MIALKVSESEVKEFMNKLLKESMFDEFDVRNVNINSFVTFDIDGLCTVDSDDEENPQTGKKYCSWVDLRSYIFNMIKGAKRPKSMKFIFSASEEQKSRILDFEATLFLNIFFENGEMRITNGLTKKEFSLDKSFDYLWDDYVKKLLKDNNIAVEELA